MDGIAGGAGMYSEPNTIIKAAHIHVEGDPSKYTLFQVPQIYFSFLQTDDYRLKAVVWLDKCFYFDRFCVIILFYGTCSVLYVENLKLPFLCHLTFYPTC